jgi:hypothetical protein
MAAPSRLPTLIYISTVVAGIGIGFLAGYVPLLLRS